MAVLCRYAYFGKHKTGSQRETGNYRFDNQFLVEESGIPGPPGFPNVSTAPILYDLFDRHGNHVWGQGLNGSGQNFPYVPAVGGSLAILGGELGTTVKAVNSSNGTVLWNDQVGDTSGRFPVVTDNFAIYAGSSRIVARTLAGDVFWQQAVTTAQAPLAVHDDSLYYLTSDRSLHAVDLLTKAPKWSPLPDVASTGASLIATEKLLFVSDPVSRTVKAFGSATGQQVWDRKNISGTFAANPTLALE